MRKVREMPRPARLTKAHKQFMLAQLARFNNSPTRINEMLRNDEVAAEWGFAPIIVHTSTVDKAIKKFDIELKR